MLLGIASHLTGRGGHDDRGDLARVRVAIGHGLGNPAAKDAVFMAIEFHALSTAVRNRADRFGQQQTRVGSGWE